jgi:hypothetical protein
MEVVKPNIDKVYIQRSQLENGKAQIGVSNTDFIQ